MTLLFKTLFLFLILRFVLGTCDVNMTTRKDYELVKLVELIGNGIESLFVVL